MIRAVLIDLDDTLLVNDMERFIPAYLERLGRFLDEHVPAAQMVPALLNGTRAMLASQDPTRFLKDVFDARFFSEIGRQERELRGPIERFYAEDFAALQALTSPMPGAHALVEAARAAGAEVVVATNPLFPRTAVEQRLGWAGLPASDPPFALVTSYESMHFAKPSAAYVAEILGRLGAQPSEAAFIGNHPDDDLAPARLLGLATFLIGPAATGGGLEQARAWLAQAPQQTDPAAAHRPPALLALLRGNLGAVHGMVAGLSPAAWRTRPVADAWSPVEIVCHLRDVEREVTQARLREVLAQDEPFLKAVDPDRWAAPRRYHEQRGPQALQDLAAARLETLAQLERLEPEAWRRPARHALLGRTDLGELIAVALEHERIHLAQLRAARAALA